MDFIKNHLISISTPRLKKINYDELVPYFSGRNITNKIFQIYINPSDSDTSLPDAIIKRIHLIKEKNPSFQYKLYTNKDIKEYIKINYGENILSYYNRIDNQYGAVKADLFRYLLIYKEGGIYHDLKIIFNKPFIESLHENDQYILSHWDNQKGEKHEGWGLFNDEFKTIERGELLMGFIISRPGHPFLREVIKEVLWRIDNYNPYLNNIGWWGVMTLTGPIMYTKKIFDLLSKEKVQSSEYRFVEISKDFGFEYSPEIMKNSLKTNYRKSFKPIVKHENALIQFINVVYMSLLVFYREKILRKQR